MATHRPKGQQWSDLELKNIGLEFVGERLADGGSLEGRVTRLKGDRDGKPKIAIHWYYGFKHSGKKKWYFCGSYPEKKIKEIRTNRDDAKVNYVQKGLIPNVQKDIQRIEREEADRETLAREAERKANAITVSELFKAWVTVGVRRKDDNKELRARFKNHVLPYVGKVLLKDLKEADLLTVYKRQTNLEKFKTAIELHKDVKQMLTWASDRAPWRKLLIEGNPASTVDFEMLIPLDYTSVRERVLSEAEIVELHGVLQTGVTSETLQLAMWICFACTCRIGELLLSEWVDVDFEAREWFIPAVNTKGRVGKKTSHRVYLSDFALSKFKQLKALAGDSGFCFPSRDGIKPVSATTFSKAVGDRQIKFMKRKNKLQNRVECDSLVLGEEAWTLHDLRRTGATMIQRLYPSARDGVLLADLCMHHSVMKGVSAHYLHHDYAEEMTEAWKLLGDRLDLLTTGKGKNIITLDRGEKRA